MTCIVALKDRDEGGVWIGTDSLLSHSSGNYVMSSPKWVIKHDTNGREMIVAAGGVLVDLQRVERFQVEYDGNLRPREVVEHQLLPHLMKVIPTKEGLTLSHFLVVYRGEIMEIVNNFAILDWREFTAVGAGGPWAMGSLYSTRGWQSAESRVLEALEVAEVYHSSVKKPMYTRWVK